MNNSWFWKHRGLIGLTIVTGIGMFLATYIFPKRDGAATIVLTLVVAMVLNHWIFLIFKVDLLDWGYKRHRF